MTWMSFRTASGPCWYTSPPSPSARSARRTLSVVWRGLAIRSWAGSGNKWPLSILSLLVLSRWAKSGGGSARSGGDSPSSISSRFLDEAVEFPGPDPEASNTAGDRIFHGVPLFLLQGGVHVEGSPFEPDGYGIVVSDWAPYVPGLYASAYDSRKDLEWRVNRTHIVRDIEDSRLIRAGVSMRNERVFYEKRSSPDDFFYVYVNFFTHLFIRVPFTKFQMVVLREASLPRPVFFHYFEVRPPPTDGWVSFTSVRERTLFRPFSDSFKNFKHHYFKIIIDAAGHHEFHDGEGNPLFPFYWRREPRKIKAFPVGALSPSDLEAVRTINALPRRISARHLVECLSLEDCGQKAFELMTTPALRQSNYMASRKRGGASSSSARPKVTPNAPRPPPLRSSGDRLPPTSDLAAVLMDPSSKAATTSVAPLVRKRKDPAVEGHKDKEGSSLRSASKRARKGKEKEKDKERTPAVPLPGGIFSPAFSMSDWTKFHMSSSQRALIEPLSEVELTNAMLEMSTRAASLAWYLKEFADRPGVEEVRAELQEEKKNSSSLQLAMEQLILNEDEYDKRIEQLEADLEKSKKEAGEANDRLAVARGDRERLLEECSQLKAKIAELEATIIFEHEEGFNKALRQVSLMAGIQEPYALGFDIEKDVFDGVLVDLNTVDDEDPAVEGPSGAVEAVEAGQAEEEARTAVVLRKELSVHRPAKLTVVPGELSVHQLGLFRARTAVVLRKELPVHRPAKLTVVPGELSVHQLGLFRARTTVVLRKELPVHRPAKLTVVPGELSVHQLGLLL
ncbi:hypothetical protein LR48_Vigan03g163600 [Vigna angularis]|uniref:Uncharacterized protein n=1 Tax=Phaseolus angularis TaxID=3914 RepID=A0A0L9U732_PHAAN|nr:hypothetical protein LR48_Vigan03g163600 [Vigna angularis]